MARMLKRDKTRDRVAGGVCSLQEVILVQMELLWPHMLECLRKEMKAHCVVVIQVSEQKDNGGLTNVSRL